MARKVQKKKTAKKTSVKKTTPKNTTIDLVDIIDSQMQKKNTPLNLSRFDKNLKEYVKNSPYQIIAQRLISDYKKKKLNASEFKFNADVIRIVKHQIKSNQF